MSSLIDVTLPHTSYKIVISPNSLEDIGSNFSSLHLGHKILVISNTEIFNYYGETVVKSLKKAGFNVFHHLIPAGETYKTLDSISQVDDVALKHRLERSSTLLA